MPYEIIRQDITKMQVDAIVDPTDYMYSGSGGTDAHIHFAAGPELRTVCVFRLYGEVDNARRLAALVVAARSGAEIRTTGDLDAAIRPALPAFAEHKYLAKVYQALRIEVNQEMRALGKFLDGAAKSLKPGGRLVVITYHSLEDRMVKNFIKSGNIDGTVEKDVYGRTDTPLRALDRKPVLPQESEIAANTRARSAKLRTAEKPMERRDD